MLKNSRLSNTSSKLKEIYIKKKNWDKYKIILIVFNK